ncbi:MAG: hypothetical protein KDA24_22990 [Deltaproteobacteria bacterium]|nr:hypothetical protein [Deltaproteobacteria bacterium]
MQPSESEIQGLFDELRALHDDAWSASDAPSEESLEESPEAPEDQDPLDALSPEVATRLEALKLRLDALAQEDPIAFRAAMNAAYEDAAWPPAEADEDEEILEGLHDDPIDGWADEEVRRFASQLGVPTAGEPDSDVSDLRKAVRNEWKRRDVEPLNTFHQWFNCVGQRGGRVVERVQPGSLSDLMEFLHGLPIDARVRVVGGGHSSSDVVDVDAGTVLIDLSLMRTLSSVDAPGWAGDYADDVEAPAGLDRLVRLPVGLSIRNLTRLLDRRFVDDDESAVLDRLNPHLAPMPAMGFPNLGGYDAQSFWGACTTGTHGTGRGLAALPGVVASVEVIVLEEDPDHPGSIRPRIEQVEGVGSRAVTDPTRFAANPHKAGWTLNSSDEALDAITVSLGFMGIVVGANVWLKDRYGLSDQVSMEWWGDLKDRLEEELDDPAFRHVQYMISGFPRLRGAKKDHRVVCMRRAEFEPQLGPDGEVPPELLEERPLQAQMLGFMRQGPTWFLNLIEGLPFPMADLLAATAMREAVTEDIERLSFVTLKLREAAYAPMIATEVFVPLDRAAEAVDLMLTTTRALHKRAFARERRFEKPLYWQVSPVAIRFVAGSTALLLPHVGEGEHYVSIEIPAARDLEDRYETLQAHIDAYRASDIPFTLHWGQWNDREGQVLADDLIPQSAVDAWERQRTHFDPHGMMARR